MTAPKTAKPSAPDDKSAHAPTLPGAVLLRTTGLTKSFGGQVVLSDIGLELHRGEVVLLRGENGSGKTTLLNILTGNLEPDCGEIEYLADGTPRNYRFPRRWWQELNPLDHFRPEFVARESIGRTWQDVRLFAAQTLRDNIAVAAPRNPGEMPHKVLFAPWLCSKHESKISQDADQILEKLGLTGRQESSADMVSLGQAKRVAMAQAIAAGAKVLFLDEPLAGLDRMGIEGVLSLLVTLVRNHNITFVIVEHVFNQHYLRELITTDWLLENGRLHRNGNSLGLPATSEEVSDSVAARPSWFHLVAGSNAEIIDEPLPRGALLTRIRRGDRWKADAKPILEIRDLIVKRGSRTIIGLGDDRKITGLNLTLREGEITILQAPNGWGKSTLVSILCGFLQPSTGEILLRGSSICSQTPWFRARHGLVGLPSDGDVVYSTLSVRDSALLAGIENPVPPLEISPNTRCDLLSGGQKQRVALSIFSSRLTGCAMAVLDEPLTGLDSESICRELTSLLSKRPASLLFLIPSQNPRTNNTR